MTDFKPSDVFLGRLLCATFGRAEREYAAVFLVLAARVHGDTWGPITLSMVQDAIRASAESMPWVVDLARNPFVQPDFADLKERGFTTHEGTGPDTAITFTPLGLHTMLPHVIPRATSEIKA